MVQENSTINGPRQGGTAYPLVRQRRPNVHVAQSAAVLTMGETRYDEGRARADEVRWDFPNHSTYSVITFEVHSYVEFCFRKAQKGTARPSLTTPMGRAPPARAHLRAATSPTCERCQANFFAQGASITLLLHAVPPLIDPVQSLKRFRTAYVYTSTYIALKYILHLVGLARWRNRSICCVRSPYR